MKKSSPVSAYDARIVNAFCRGGVGARILMVAITLVVVGVCIMTILSRQQESQQYHYANSLRIAEYGLEQALVKLGENAQWTEGLPRTAYNEGWYSVTVTHAVSNDTTTLVVESRGSSGNAHRTRSLVFRRDKTPQGDSVWFPRSAQ